MEYIVIGGVAQKLVGTLCKGQVIKCNDQTIGNAVMANFADGSSAIIKYENLLPLDELESKCVDDLEIGDEFVALVHNKDKFDIKSNLGGGIVIDYNVMHHMPQSVVDVCIKWAKLYNNDLRVHNYIGLIRDHTAYFNKGPLITSPQKTSGAYCSCNQPVLKKNCVLGKWFDICKICGKEKV